MAQENAPVALTHTSPATQMENSSDDMTLQRIPSSEEWCVNAAKLGLMAAPLAALIRLLLHGAPLQSSLRTIGIHEVLFAQWLDEGMRHWRDGDEGHPFAQLAKTFVNDRSDRVVEKLQKLDALIDTEEGKTALDSVKLALAFMDEEMDRESKAKGKEGSGRGGITVMLRSFTLKDGTSGTEVSVSGDGDSD